MDSPVKQTLLSLKARFGKRFFLFQGVFHAGLVVFQFIAFYCYPIWLVYRNWVILLSYWLLPAVMGLCGVVAAVWLWRAVATKSLFPLCIFLQCVGAIASMQWYQNYLISINNLIYFVDGTFACTYYLVSLALAAALYWYLLKREARPPRTKPVLVDVSALSAEEQRQVQELADTLSGK